VYFADYLVIWPLPPLSREAAKEATLHGDLMSDRAVGSDVQAHPHYTNLSSRQDKWTSVQDDKLWAVTALLQFQ
jgi:hypothetical protein